MNMPKLLLSVLAAGILLAAGCASQPSESAAPAGPLVAEPFYASADGEPLYGTWLNPGNKPPTFYPKVISHPWGLVEYFQTPSSTTYAWRGTSTIVERWTDERGATWYKEFIRCSLKGFYSGHSFSLDRISPDGTTLECIFGNLDWPSPSEMDPDLNTTYVIFHRQQQ